MSIRLPRIAARVVCAALFCCIALSAIPASAQITSESENNNAESAADGPVGSGTRVAGSLSTSSDIDWFYFDLTAASTIGIRLNHDAGDDFDWALYKATGGAVASGKSSAIPEAGSYAATTTGRYKLKVTAYRGSARYDLDLTLTAAGGGGGGGGGGGASGGW